jgi:hypothetical protein
VPCPVVRLLIRLQLPVIPIRIPVRLDSPLVVVDALAAVPHVDSPIDKDRKRGSLRQRWYQRMPKSPPSTPAPLPQEGSKTSHALEHVF